MSDVQTLFKRHFGCTPTHVVHAPGQSELLGRHALCRDGLAISAAINKSVSIASTPRRDGKVELVSPSARTRSFWLSEITLNPAAQWADGFKAVLDQLRRRGANLSGFSAAIWDDMPPGWTSAPAALAVAAALTLRRLYPFSLTETGITVPPRRNSKGELPPIAPREAQFRQTLSGISQSDRRRLFRTPRFDFLSFWQGLASPDIDLRFHTIELAPMIGEVLIVCYTPTAAEPEEAATPSAEQIQRCCESAVVKLAAEIAAVDGIGLLGGKPVEIDASQYKCASFVAGEISRIVAAERILRDEDHRQFGQFMLQSQESSCDLLKDTTPVCDLLIDLARAQPGCHGARGIGGCGGATVNLVAYHQAESFMKHVPRRYETRTGGKLQTFLCQMADGVS